jgi:hypothetical protein
MESCGRLMVGRKAALGFALVSDEVQLKRRAPRRDRTTDLSLTKRVLYH